MSRVNRSYLTVTALTKYIKQKMDLDPHLSEVWLRGEISNFNHHRRGHMYMTIKDENSRIQSVMFAGNNRSLKFMPENGMNVLLHGNISVFEPYGQYQLYIKHMEPDGIGSLHLAFEQLKEKLRQKGFFEQAIKKSIPQFPKHIGIITSPTGAAVKDIITTIKRRYPVVKLTVIPVQVQGDGAAKSIKQGIQRANEMACFDLLITGRGGGSIEDLWAFNEEIVAQAIFNSTIPIISAVGHETDTTISDFVSDLRAPTPTSAAEIAVPSQVELKHRLISLERHLSRNISLIFKQKKEQLRKMQQSYGLRSPKQLIEQKEQQFDHQQERLVKGMISALQKYQYELDHLNIRFKQYKPQDQLQLAKEQLKNLTEQKRRSVKEIFQTNHSHFMKNLEKLTLVNPLNIMKRGFTIAYSDKNNIIKTSKQINKNDNLTLRFIDGTVTCQVKDIGREDDES